MYLHFLADTLGDGHGSHTTRLGASDSLVVRKPSFGQVLRHLGGLAGTSLADDDEDLVLR